jgi:hypothetical protein
MASAYATKLAEAFSAKLMKQVYAKSIFNILVNRDYQGEVQRGSKVNIPALARVSEKIYSGSALTADDISEIVAVLTVDQFKSFYVKSKTLDEYKSFIKDPMNKTVDQRASERKKNVDSFVLGFYGDVGAGNRVGTDYATGTVTITVTTGAVVGDGTTFTAAMVGKGFKAAGHTKWYRVKSYASATSIVIENDSDDEASAYDGGAINAGATYTVEAATKVQIATNTIYSKILDLKQKLDAAEVPDEGRMLFIPSLVENVLLNADKVTIAVPSSFDMVQRGSIGRLAGFEIIKTERVYGNNTDGYHCIAATSDWLTFADKVLESGMEEDLPGDFGAAFKDLYVYGAKVADERRKFAAELFCYV